MATAFALDSENERILSGMQTLARVSMCALENALSHDSLGLVVLTE